MGPTCGVNSRAVLFLVRDAIESYPTRVTLSDTLSSLQNHFQRSTQHTYDILRSEAYVQLRAGYPLPVPLALNQIIPFAVPR